MVVSHWGRILLCVLAEGGVEAERGECMCCSPTRFHSFLNEGRAGQQQQQLTSSCLGAVPRPALVTEWNDPLLPTELGAGFYE